MTRFARTIFRLLILLILAVSAFNFEPAYAQSGDPEPLRQERAESLWENGPQAPAWPEIDIWYGSTQYFGWSGKPQRQVNILGNAYSPYGIASLTYSLNGGLQRPLSLGPDSRRLLSDGDFNVELFDSELKQGSNAVVIRARDNDGVSYSATVNVIYDRSNVWPLPTTVHWNPNVPVNDQAQVVDGKWNIFSDGIRTVEIGYDRLVAIGDMSWKDYEITVPVTIHSVDPAGYNPPSNNPGVGVLLRWAGHTDDPISGTQPKEGYLPFGAMTWYTFRKDGDGERMQIYGNNSIILADDTSGSKLSLGTTYYFKARVETVGNRPYFRFKVWSEGSMEPPSWKLSAYGAESDPAFGSLLLLAHHTDVTFGDVTVVPLNSETPPVSTLVSDDFSQCSLNNGLWQFKDPLGDGSYGISGGLTQDAALSISVPAGSEHNFAPGALLAPRVVQAVNDTDFDAYAHFDSGLSQANQMQGIVVEQDENNFLRLELRNDGSGIRVFAASYFSDGEIIQGGAPLGAENLAPAYLAIQRIGPRWISYYSLDGSNWTAFASFLAALTPNQVGVYAANGGGSAPAHTALVDFFYNDDAPLPTEDQARNTLTVTVNGDGTVVREPDLANYACGQQVTLTANPNAGWSFANWSDVQAGSGNPATLTMNGAKTVTANFTAREYTLDTSAIGSGKVVIEPLKPTYHYGDQVTLTAVPDPGWALKEWTGDAEGQDPKETITITIIGNAQVAAVFTQAQYTLSIVTLGSGSVTVSPFKEKYRYGEQVTLTAIPDAGWEFGGWSVGASGTETPKKISIDANTNVIAFFVSHQIQIFVPIAVVR